MKLTSTSVRIAGQLFRQLVDLFQFYMAFPISNFESEPISDEEAMAAQYARLQKLQLLLFYKHPALRDLALVNCGALATRKTLAEHLQDIPLPELQKLVAQELRYDSRHMDITRESHVCSMPLGVF